MEICKPMHPMGINHQTQIVNLLILENMTVSNLKIFGPYRPNNLKNFLLILLAFISLASLKTDKDRNITGTVYAADDNASIPGVHITIADDGKTSNTDAQGHYQIMVPNGKTRLVFTMVGYKTDTVTIGKSDILDVRLIKTIIYKGDTVNYRASAYIIGDNALHEVVISKPAPANTVYIRGYGTSQGQSTTRVRINGKDFTSGTINQATQNLPADILQSIQVIDSYGDQGRRSIIQNPGNESYSRIVENHFEDPKATPLSTFAVDVDAASYSNFRRFINSGQLPPKNAVRIEEMVNYFHYNLPEPTNGDPVAIHTELSATPWNPQHRLLRIGLKAKDVKTDKLPPSNLVFLLDVSGSMSEPNKLPLVKASMKLLVDQLRAQDHVAIVVYAGEAGLKLASTPGSDKTKIKEVIDQLYAGGSTAGGAGIMMAYEVAKSNFIKGGNNRIILATDGDFNVGASSNKDMQQLIEDERQSGVSISILGFGMGNLKDSKMEIMADKGHGNYAYIDNITEATKAMVTEFGGTLFTVAKDVKMQIEFNPAKVQAYRLLGYEDRLLNKEDFNNDKKLGGDMGVNHTVTALYEIIPAGIKDSFANSVDPLKYQKTDANVVLNNSPDMVTIKFRYKEPESDQSKMEQVVVNDQPVALAKTSDDFRFAASVVELGLLLRDSEYKQQSGFKSLIEMAKGAKGKDDDGYRAEFIRLAESAALLSKSADVATVDLK